MVTSTTCPIRVKHGMSFGVTFHTPAAISGFWFTLPCNCIHTPAAISAMGFTLPSPCDCIQMDTFWCVLQRWPLCCHWAHLPAAETTTSTWTIQKEPVISLMWTFLECCHLSWQMDIIVKTSWPVSHGSRQRFSCYRQVAFVFLISFIVCIIAHFVVLEKQC